MRYGIIGQAHPTRAKRHFGLLYDDGDGTITLKLINKGSSCKIRGRNKKIFQEILNILSKYYKIEDLNRKNKSGSRHLYRKTKIYKPK